MNFEMQPSHNENSNNSENMVSLNHDALDSISMKQEDIEEPRILGSGLSGKTYAVDNGETEFAIKIGHNKDEIPGADSEYALLKLLQLRGDDLSPEPIYYDKADNILITKRVEGEKIGEITDEDIRNLARTVGAIHAKEYERPGKPFEERIKISQYEQLQKQIESIVPWLEQTDTILKTENMDETISETLYSAFEKIKIMMEEKKISFENSSFSLIHYDLNPSNILKNKDKLSIIDWRSGFIGDRALDIAKLFYKNYLDNEKQELFLKEYSALIPDKTIKERISVYYPLVRIISTLWRLKHLNIDIKTNPELKESISTNLVESRLHDDLLYLKEFSETK